MLPSIGPLGHVQSFSVGTFDIDHRKQLTVPALVRIMQEAAMQNVLRLNLSVWDLEPLDLAWVLMRQRIDLHRLPLLGESFTVHTQPVGFEKVFTFRDFYVYDAKDQLIATSTTTWLLMNTETRRMTRIPPPILAFQKEIPADVARLPEALAKLPAVDHPEPVHHYTVQWYDLDFNMHLNNTYYSKWMLEASPLPFLQGQQLKSVDLLFRAEAQLGDQIVAERQALTSDHCMHRLFRESDQKELALARTTWV
jgi:medium-chain acyl-[acyl-carrier-protein] hydrolase